MISVKGGTQTWSNTPQRTDFKPDGTQSMSAGDAERTLGGDSVGDMLNKVADPNYVDASKKMRTVGKAELGKDAFMTLLLTQMKNQDPTSPLKSHEMAAQLAQFTSLEKLNNINDAVNGLRQDQQPDHNFQALSFIGKTIQTDNSRVAHSDKDAHHDVRFTLPADAPKMTMAIKDAEGKTVRTLEFKNLKTGKNELSWNGLMDDGSAAPVGEYSVAMDAVGSNGAKLHVETRTEGVISGVNFTPQGPQLMVGNKAVSMAEVRSITDQNVSQPAAAPQMPQMPAGFGPNGLGGGIAPTGAQNTQQNFPGSVQGPKKVEVKPEFKANAAKAAMMKGSLNDASMAQGLINELNKSGAKAGMEG